jgi:polyribonucleotide nucleotidyltransferase
VFEKITKKFPYGAHTVTLETGEIARQSGGAVVCSMDDTVVLATVVARKEAKPGQDFFPLTVDYVEKTYAAGRIPGGFFKREGRPSEKETLTSRLIDRPIRPLFPDGFFNEVQVVIHVLSSDPEIDPDIPAMIGASAALSLSGIPFKGPIGAARVAYIDGQYVLNPTGTQLKNSKLNLVVAGTERGDGRVEADQLSEEVMLGAVMYGHSQMQAAINAIHELVRDAGKATWEWQAPAKNETLLAKLVLLAGPELRDAYQTRNKQARTHKINDVYTRVWSRLEEDAAATATPKPDDNAVDGILFDLQAKIVRSQILDGEARIDGRDTRTVRPIEIRLGVLPRTHGSALFTRGETQALVTATAVTNGRQIIDAARRISRALHASLQHAAVCDRRDRQCRGAEASRDRPRRLRQAALLAVLPSYDDFQYSLRVVSKSPSPMVHRRWHRVCGGCLAMMDAGVPLKAHVAGVAMGLIKGRQQVRRPHRQSLVTRTTSATWISRLRLGQRHHRAADGHQDRRHHAGDHAGRAGAGQRRPHAHSAENAGRNFGVARRALGVRAAADQDEDQPGEDPRRDRQGRRGNPRVDRGDRHADRHRGRRHGHHRQRRPGKRPRGSAPHPGADSRSRGWQGLRRHGIAPARLRRDCADPAAETVCCTSRRSPTSVSMQWPTI